MSVSSTIRKLTRNKINHAAEVSSYFERPVGGWIAAFQYAIGLNVKNLAGRLGVSCNSVYRARKNEQSGSISLNQLNKIAGAMGGKLVYAIIPIDGQVEKIIMNQARKKADKIIRRAYAHMALEDQTEGLPDLESLIENLTEEMVQEIPRNFWN